MPTAWRTRLSATPLVAVLAMLAACSTSGTDLGFPPEETGTVVVVAYLDRDGNRTFTPVVDTLVGGARIALLLKGSSDTVRTVATGNNGVASFTQVPLGEYRLGVVASSLGDSIQVGSIDSSFAPSPIGTIRLETAPDSVGAAVRLTFPEVTLRQVRTMPLGKRVTVRGVILAGVQSFRDTTSHMSDSSGALRLTRVVLRGGLVGNTPGDSVSVIGLTSTRTGQPTLDQSVITRFATRPPPVPVQVNTATAATAANGVLDANLVNVTGATISDTSTVAPDFKVTVSDGSGSVVILLDGNLPFVRSAFRPARSLNARGVLVPDGAGRWSIKPRDPNDVVLF